MRDISPTTAAQRVVCIPELVGEILSWLVVKDSKQYQGKGAGNILIFADFPTLARCGRINRVWFEEAMPILWRQATKLCQFSLPQKFAHIKSCRRQFYANFITTGNLVDSKRENVRSSTRALHGVIFPRLRCLKLIVDCRPLKFCMPRLRAPGLELIEIHAAFIR
ncbi:uncharacterized protein N7459_000091 [Penicillium hispanicum]|uniref:uncharacterized protein n=1 Tax=Penicillium hispanicum TaxID=1080232 RepID=UPI00253F80B0|nr:uncharacterized protein N7459_000091 [Penicillium hispanicum]KAJ5593883.1 hypothetical protein N7459_000091 [Penicillium hispanicum]